MNRWTITLPPVEGGRTIAVDEVNLIAFVKKNGYSDSAKYINRGEGFTFQGTSGGFYKIHRVLAAFGGLVLHEVGSKK